MSYAYLKKLKNSFDPFYIKKVSFFTWLKCCYLSLRYVDEFKVFPCIQIEGNCGVKIYKSKNAKLIVKNKLIIEAWLNKRIPVNITISEDAQIICNNSFILGSNVSVFLDKGAQLILGGKNKEKGSGITADAVVMVKKRVEIGEDCIIAWNTYITDCDWHSIQSKPFVKETIIGAHNWIGVGTKILKGVETKENCIIASNSVVLNGLYKKNSLISGNPAKVIKEDYLNWNRDMINW